MLNQDSGNYGYFAFGLYLSANAPIPGLCPARNPGVPGIKISFGGQPPDTGASGLWDLWYSSTYALLSGIPHLRIYRHEVIPDLYWMRYTEGPDIYVGGGASSIWAMSAPGLSREDVATYLIGPVMAFLLQLRGSTLLHGSAVAIDDRAVVILGPPGAGKSTTAGAFACRGYPVATDDIVILSEHEGQFSIVPAYPGLRLWSSSVELLLGRADALPQLSPEWEKRGLDLTLPGYRFQPEPLPVAGIYVLAARVDEDSAPRVRDLAGAAAVLALLGNSWSFHQNEPSVSARELRAKVKLSRSVPVRELIPHSDGDRLGALCQLLIRNVETTAASTSHTSLVVFPLNSLLHEAENKVDVPYYL